MVRVVVRDAEAGDGVEADADLRETFLDGLAADPGVHEDPGAFRFDVDAVAAAAAGQDAKLHRMASCVFVPVGMSTRHGNLTLPEDTIVICSGE